MNHPSEKTVRLLRLQESIRNRKGLIACGSGCTLIRHHSGRILFVGADRFGQGEVQRLTRVSSIASGGRYCVALHEDGTLSMAGASPVARTEIESLASVRRVACGAFHVAVLLENGCVLTGGAHPLGAGETTRWQRMTDVVCGRGWTAGVDEYGQVLLADGSRRMREALHSWQSVVGLFAAADGETLYALSSAGHLLASSPLHHKTVYTVVDTDGKAAYVAKPCTRAVWRNLVFVAASSRHLWAITASGRLISTDPAVRQLDPSQTFVACDADEAHVLLLTREGRLLALGEDPYGACRVNRLPPLFADFDEFIADRRTRLLRPSEEARLYQLRYVEAERSRHRLVSAKGLVACLTADGRVLTTTGFKQAKSWDGVRALAAGNAHLLALHTDGCVSADGNDVDGSLAVDDWRQIKAIAAGKYHSLGLCDDGRVLFCGRNDRGQGLASEWTGIRALYAADEYTVGVGYDGTVRIAGESPFDPSLIDSAWKNPADVVVTATHMAALYADGTVRTTCSGAQTDSCHARHRGRRHGHSHGIHLHRKRDRATTCACDTADWRYVRAIAAGDGFTVALCYGGSVLVSACNEAVRQALSAVETWRHIIALDCGAHYVVGLDAHGRVFTLGDGTVPASQIPQTETWNGILTLTAGPTHLVAATREGQILVDGGETIRELGDTTHFSLFRDIRQLYGYGRFRKAAEGADSPHLKVDTPDDAPTGLTALSPDGGAFATYTTPWRADTESLSGRISICGDRVAYLTLDGQAVHYLLSQGAAMIEAAGHAPVRSVVATRSSTILLYADGQARERLLLNPELPLAALPNRLGVGIYNPVRAAAAGLSHHAVLRGDGTVCAFGDNSRGQCDTASLNGIVALAVGSAHTVALCRDGRVVAVGNRTREQGRSPRGVAHRPRANPCATDEWRGVVAIAAGEDVTLGICRDGRVLSVGSSHFGQCNTDGWRDTVAVSTSGRHTVALFSDGHVEAIGLNERGECRTAAWSRMLQVIALPSLTLGLCADGRVLAAGDMTAPLTFDAPVRAMASDGRHTVVFVLCDGRLCFYTRGHATIVPIDGPRLFVASIQRSILARTAPAVPPILAARALRDSFAVGMAHVLRLSGTGSVLFDGSNDLGQCDLLKSGDTAVHLAAAGYRSAAVLSDGTIRLAGQDVQGACDAIALNRELNLLSVGGDAHHGHTESEKTATPTFAWSRVACGSAHTAALRTDGRVFAIGKNSDGRCDTRPWRRITEIACGTRHTVGLCLDGTCVATGDDRYGQCRVGSLRQVTMIAAGEFHTVALTADGRVTAVGDDRAGQCRVEDLTDIIAVAALPDATLCLRADGRVILRGGDDKLRPAVEALREIVALSTCEYRIAALTADSRVVIAGV